MHTGWTNSAAPLRRLRTTAMSFTQCGQNLESLCSTRQRYLLRSHVPVSPRALRVYHACQSSP